MSEHADFSGSGKAVGFDPYHKWLGIHPSEQPPHFYRLLGITPFESDADVIANATDARMAHVKNFQAGAHSDSSQRILNELARAKLCLLAPTKKAEYDQWLRERLPAAKRAASIDAATFPLDEDDRCEMWRDAVVERQADPMDFLNADNFKPTMAIAKSRRKKSSDMFTVMCILGATAVAVAVILPLYLNENQNDNSTSVPTKSRASAPRRSPTNPVQRQPKVDEEISHPRNAHVHPRIGSNRSKKPTNPIGNSGSELPEPTPPLPNSQRYKLFQSADKELPKVIPPLRIDVTLPSGAVLCESMLEVPDCWQDKYFPETVVIYVAKWPNGEVCGLFSLDDAKLDGWAIALHESGNMQTLAYYKKARLEGRMIQWKENGERLFYAEHKSGNKHGLFCLFRDDLPWLIQEWNKGSIQSEYLVKYLDDGPRLTPKAEMSDQESEGYGKAASELAVLESTLENNENKLKQELAKWYRQERDRLKRGRLSKSSPDKRNRMLDDIYRRSKTSSNALMMKRRSLERGKH